jgi:predicted flap endonuclease-1-like 5' DNA nuclease
VAVLPASPSVVPRAPATPSSPYGVSPGFARPPTPPAPSVTAQLEQRLGAAQVELRKLGSERHTLRARLRREADRVRELESALGAEKDLRRQASDEHHAALSGLRLRLAELEAEKDQALQRLAKELAEARAAALPPAPARSGKVLRGLRRIRGIGPAYQRSLEQLEITRVQQIAAWTEADVLAFAEKLRIRSERIFQEDWVGQARALEPDPED